MSEISKLEQKLIIKKVDKEEYPDAVFLSPVVFLCKDSYPDAVLLDPELLSRKE